MKILQRIGYAMLFVVLGLVGIVQLSRAPMTSEHPPEVVLDALASLDIRRQPGEPGSTAGPAGGILPEFRQTRSSQAISWTVMSGDLVATTMTAKVEPGWLWGSWIKAEVTRGNAPDERTSPAFRSESLTLGLFRSAIGDSLRLIGSPGWGEHCDALDAAMLAEGNGVLENAVGPSAIGNRLKERGCDIAARPSTFREVTCTMCDGDEDASEPPDAVKDDDASKESGFKTVSPY